MIPSTHGNIYDAGPMGEYRTARARLKRAAVHGETLSARWNAIPNEDLFTVHPMVNPAGQGRIRLIANKPVPEEFSLLLGEMLYQLRSALDAAAGQVYSTRPGAADASPPNAAALASRAALID
jgi:hypothetical protein